MTKEEMLARIDKIEAELFMIEMIDHWRAEDREKHSALTKELFELRAKVGM